MRVSKVIKDAHWSGCVRCTVTFAEEPHKRKPAACAAGVVTKTTDRDSLRYTYNGTGRVRQLALGCECN